MKTILLALHLFLFWTLIEAPLRHNTLPECFDQFDAADSTFTKTHVKIENESIVLDGYVYAPRTQGPHPAAVMMHGGGGNVEILRITPNFFAARLAACGIAAIVYDKRGTGESGGDYSSSTFDDFVDDAGAAANYLATLHNINRGKIGIVGFSQGGRLAPVVAVRHPVISFAVSVSGPMTSVGDTRLYAVENSFLEIGIGDSLMNVVMPLWKEHFDALERRDMERLEVLDNKLTSVATDTNISLLPPSSKRIPRMGIYNSMGRDYTTELEKLKIPWLSIYGENDVIVPVARSIEILEERMRKAGNTEYEVVLMPNASHSFYDSDTRESVPFENVIFDWIIALVG